MSPAKRDPGAAAPAPRPRKPAAATAAAAGEAPAAIVEPLAAPVVPSTTVEPIPSSDPFDGPPRRVVDRPFIWGATAALGVLLVAMLALAVFSLSGIVFSIFMAAFITVGLDPLVRWLERKGLKRGIAILIVILAILAIAITIIWVVVPVVVEQLRGFISSLPAAVERLEAEGWFDGTNEASNGVIGTVLTTIADAVKDPAFWATLGTGVVKLGLGIASAISSAFFILILTIYFIGTYDVSKEAGYRLVARSHRETFRDYSERILENVGRYLSGMVTLAFMNATFTTILLVATGIPGALLLGIIAFFITVIPLVGTVLTTIIMSIIAFIYDPTAGIIVLILMLIYMQVEAYVLTPKIMSKAVKVPGSVVLISALAGGTLGGLAGALVAIPISAAILLILKGIVMPRKELA